MIVSILKFLHLSNFYIVLGKLKRMFIRHLWQNTFLLHYKETWYKQLIKGSFILWDMWVIELWQNSWFDFQLVQWSFIKPVEMENQFGPISCVSCITELIKSANIFKKQSRSSSENLWNCENINKTYATEENQGPATSFNIMLMDRHFWLL